MDNGRINQLPRHKPATWIESGRHVQIQGYNISGGMIYVGEDFPDLNGYGNDACLIDTRLQSSPGNPQHGDKTMRYCSNYGHMTDKSRGAYLKWLEDGRSSPRAHSGYVHLFLYGLERRLLVDGPKGKVSKKERLAIVAELNRLLKIYHCVGKPAEDLLSMEWILFQEDAPLPDYLIFNGHYFSAPFQVALARHIVSGKLLPVEMALQFLALRSKTRFRTPVWRCAEEFRTLFALRYKQAFGKGLRIRPGKTRLKLNYRPANPSMQINFTFKTPDLPDPFILTAPLKKILSLGQTCANELSSHDGFIGDHKENKNSLTAMSRLPHELLSRIPAVKKIKTHLARICNAGPGLIPVADIQNRMGENWPASFNKKEAKVLAIFLEKTGFGMAPDVRYHTEKPHIDGSIVIFQGGHGVDFQASKEFLISSAILRLGSILARTCPNQSADEEQLFQRLPMSHSLSPMEKKSLLALLSWGLRNPQSVFGIKKQLAEISEGEKMDITHQLTSLAHAGGHIYPEKVAQLKRVYAAIGMEKKSGALQIASTEP